MNIDDCVVIILLITNAKNMNEILKGTIFTKKKANL